MSVARVLPCVESNGDPITGIKRLVIRIALVCVIVVVLWNARYRFNGELSKPDSNSTSIKATVSNEDDPEFVPEQQQFQMKGAVKLDRAYEKKLACEQIDCEIDCNKKIKPQCSAKKSCQSDRHKLCKRRCFKTRCETRCKDEPHYGYVEREQKMEKCKEGCTGTNTATHNKCIKKCHSEFKPCKSRCHEAAARFVCDSAKSSKLAFEAPVAEPEISTESEEKEDFEDDEAI